MSTLFYTYLASLFYWAGDIISRLPSYPYSLYSWLMKKSLDFDEKAGYQLWKEPTNK